MGHDVVSEFQAIIVAAGSGSRAGGDSPKQYRDYRGQPLLAHSVESLLAHNDLQHLVVVIGAGQEQQAGDILPHDPRITITMGGDSRMASVANGVAALAKTGIDANSLVLVHDAARPGLSHGVIDRLLAALEDHAGAVPVLPMVDSMTENAGALLGEAVDRDAFVRVQTPQAFRFGILAEAHKDWSDEADAVPTDDARMVQQAGHNVAAVEGDERLGKITFAEDFIRDGEIMESKTASPLPVIRIGNGYDVHRFEPGDHIWLCGVKIGHNAGLKGHSDADVGLHALTDALLGALAIGDIGDHFPDNDPRWAGASSDRFLEHAAVQVRRAGYKIGNVDITLICEAPKVKPHRETMRSRVAEILGLSIDTVSIKATTTEALGFTGRREGIAAQASALIVSAN
ncbi:MAG: bifunctional 2-C-methyl-D-erythritol 4-phosphate cytidylyltransferase/2-C-methyl-D-erythritol 2,4-cyclodiphosphate synthase [Pseudomonadota bacterium]